MRDIITGDWLLGVGFVRLVDRWHFDLDETTSMFLQRTRDGTAWQVYVEVDGIAVKLPRRLVTRANVVTLIPALGGKLHHLVTIEAVDADARRTLAFETSVEAHLSGGEAARRLCHSEG